MEYLEEKEDDHEDVMESVESGSNSGLGGPMEATWARMAEEEEEVSIRRRRKLLKGFDEFLRNSVKVEEEVLEKLGCNTTCSRQTRSDVVAPLRKFGEELRGRWLELGGEGWMKSVMNVMRALKVENADDLETAFIEMRNASQNVEGLRNENERLIEELSNSERIWKREKEELKRTVRKLSKTAEQWRRRAEEAEMAAKPGQGIEENSDGSTDDSEGSENFLSKRESLRRNSSRRYLSTASERRQSGQEARQKKKKCSGASKWDKNSAKWDEKVSKWPNDAWWERGYMKTLYSEQDAETVEEVVASMNKMMRVAALPEPKVFDGSGSFGEFKRTFLMKFREVVDDDEDLVAILEENFLVGTAKSLFRSLENRRKRPIKVLFEEFEEKLKRRQGDNQTHALAVFEELSRGAGQKMWSTWWKWRSGRVKVTPEADKTTI
uniref:Uncharacterized protein n=1 Tax=Caenorhabditis japonica TaxID=281687 RepID=A0A8R1IF02_CAEJA